jgi:cytochrome o ubiquinol oxidase subunit 2
MAKNAVVLATVPLLAGCNMVVIDPAGDVARQQGNLVMISTGLMLLVIVPVMILTVLFAWRYRAANREARYEPDWDHSTQLELVIWAAPLLIIICLGALTWVSTHLLDPYRPLARTAPGAPVEPTAKPLDVQVVALDWKWLFIYPEQGIATVNELALPVNRPVRFSISASSVMNSFYIPAMAGQIYAMPGMETKLHAVLNHPGTYDGFSANYSGAGFSGMRFKVKGMDDAAFAQWVATARTGTRTLDRATYLALERPSENVRVQRFASVEGGLFDAVVNMCVEPGKMCARDVMELDAKGGMGIAGIHNLRTLAYDKFGARGLSPAPFKADAIGALCLPRPGDDVSADLARPVNPTPLVGAGLSRPAPVSTSASLIAAADSGARPFATGNP